eukprot:PITA_33823
MKRALYGLKQSPRAWNTRIDNYLRGLGLTKSEAGANLYYIMVGGLSLILVLYVDDLILTGDESLIQNYKEDLAREFEMERYGANALFLWLGDADWVESSTDKKSTSGGMFNIGSTAVSSYSWKKRSVALSSAKAKYMAASQATCKAIWMRKLFVGLFRQRIDPTTIHCNNQSCIKLSENPVFHDRSKHIEFQYHHLRDCLQKG